MDNLEHARRLRKAISASGVDRKSIAAAVNRGVRTLTNWTTEKHPTMPTEKERQILRELVGNYDAEGDPVQIALRESDLVDWRQSEVWAVYQRMLYEQSQGLRA